MEIKALINSNAVLKLPLVILGDSNDIWEYSDTMLSSNRPPIGVSNFQCETHATLRKRNI